MIFPTGALIRFLLHASKVLCPGGIPPSWFPFRCVKFGTLVVSVEGREGQEYPYTSPWKQKRKGSDGYKKRETAVEGDTAGHVNVRRLVHHRKFSWLQCVIIRSVGSVKMVTHGFRFDNAIVFVVGDVGRLASMWRSHPERKS